MLGIYRYLLINLVIVAHFWPPLNQTSGVYAVFGFYTLSGYLTALVLDKVYVYSPAGILRFLVNRLLRIYPAYFTALLLSVCIVYFIPEATRTVRVDHLMRFPDTLEIWFHNIFIVGLAHDRFRLVPDAWFVDLLLVFYVLMAVLFRKRRIVLLWFIGSLLLTGYMVISGYGFSLRYGYIRGITLPFSLGALLFHYREKFTPLPKWHIVPAAILFFGNTIWAARLWHDPWHEGFYVSLGLSTYLLVTLINLSQHTFPGWFVKCDRLLGNISYPMFLCQWQTACLVAWSGLRPISVPRGPEMLFGVTPFVNIVALFIYIVVETNVSRLRNTLKKNAVPERKRAT